MKVTVWFMTLTPAAALVNITVIHHVHLHQTSPGWVSVSQPEFSTLWISQFHWCRPDPEPHRVEESVIWITREQSITAVCIKELLPALVAG